MQTGTIFDIKYFAVHDGPGIRTTVFFKGCPLNCLWCHNPESINPQCETIHLSRKMDGKIYPHTKSIGEVISTAEIISKLEKDQLIMDESGGGVTFSGGEPMLQPHFLKELLTECKNRELHTTVDTSGFASESILNEIIPLTDLFLFDLKSLNPDLHEKGTGVPLSVILKSFKIITEHNKDIRLRIPVIPEFNYSKTDLANFKKFINDHKNNIKAVHLLPYHSIAKNKYKNLGIENSYSNQESLKKEDLSHWKKELDTTNVPIIIGG